MRKALQILALHAQQPPDDNTGSEGFGFRVSGLGFRVLGFWSDNSQYILYYCTVL